MITYDTPQAYVEAKIKVNDDGCWIWQNVLSSNGYGQAKMNYKRDNAHRFSYRAFKGVIGDGLQIDHLCRVRSCVNPEHLEAVTARENIARSNSKAKRLAARTHCPKGHPFNEANTYIVRRDGRQIGRMCRPCHNTNEKRRYTRLQQTRRMR